jgi:hypothetical protein
MDNKCRSCSLYNNKFSYCEVGVEADCLTEDTNIFKRPVFNITFSHICNTSKVSITFNKGLIGYKFVAYKTGDRCFEANVFKTGETFSSTKLIHNFGELNTEEVFEQLLKIEAKKELKITNVFV